MSSWSKDQKVCCTCRYWSAQREIDFTASFFEAKESEATCNGPDGSFKSSKTGEGASCSYWEKFR